MKIDFSKRAVVSVHSPSTKEEIFADERCFLAIRIAIVIIINKIYKFGSHNCQFGVLCMWCVAQDTKKILQPGERKQNPKDPTFLHVWAVVCCFFVPTYTKIKLREITSFSFWIIKRICSSQDSSSCVAYRAGNNFIWL